MCISGGQAKTLMFVHISPEPDALGETISTMKFAERVSTVELGAAKVNKDSADVKELKEQVLTFVLFSSLGWLCHCICRLCIINVECFYSPMFQIASLKAALAKKDGEAEHFQHQANSILEMPRLKSQLSSPTPSSSTSGGRKLPRDDSSSSLEVYTLEFSSVPLFL